MYSPHTRYTQHNPIRWALSSTLITASTQTKPYQSVFVGDFGDCVFLVHSPAFRSLSVCLLECTDPTVCSDLYKSILMPNYCPFSDVSTSVRVQIEYKQRERVGLTLANAMKQINIKPKDINPWKTGHNWNTETDNIYLKQHTDSVRITEFVWLGHWWRCTLFCFINNDDPDIVNQQNTWISLCK